MVRLEFAEHALEMRASVESLFMLATVGDMLGIPVLPPYYSLRLLPYVMPQINTWKRRVLREREFTDEHDYHLEWFVRQRPVERTDEHVQEIQKNRRRVSCKT